jgi:apolipoprotein N-acyltransferase
MSSNILRLCTIVSSALLGACAFLQPAYCGWFVFIYLIPLFYSVTTHGLHYRFIDGLLWGCIFFGLHMHGLLRVILDHAQTKGAGVFSWGLLIIYCSFYAGIWFWFAEKFSSFCVKPIARIFCWVVVTFCFFYFVEDGILWIFGRLEGYPFAMSLLPLAAYPSWLFCLSLFGSNCLTIVLFLIPVFFSLCLISKSIFYRIALFFTLLPFLIGWFWYEEKMKVPHWIHELGCIIPPAMSNNNSFECAQEITYCLMNYCERNRKARILIMPESSYPFALNEHPEAVEMWAQNVLFEDKTLLLGSHRRSGKELFNAFYCIKKRRIIFFYDKKHTIPFVEYLPQPWCNLKFLQSLFLHKKEQFNVSQKPRTPFSPTKKVTMLPYICSELFFAKNKENSQEPIVCLVNDAWFSACSMRTLLYLVACYKALTWNHDILYVASSKICLINKNGISCDLASCLNG